MAGSFLNYRGTGIQMASVKMSQTAPCGPEEALLVGLAPGGSRHKRNPGPKPSGRRKGALVVETEAPHAARMEPV